MDNIQGKHFSITDPEGVKTVIYQVNKTEKEFLKDYPKFTVERLDHSVEFVGNLNRKTFYVNNPQKEGITKRPTPFKFDTIYSEQELQYKEFTYTPNLKRPISIIDPETTEEVKPTLYFDEETNEVKGKCKLKPYKSYFAFEIRDGK